MSRPSKQGSTGSEVPPRPSTNKTKPSQAAPGRPSSRTETVRRRRNQRLLAWGASAVVIVVIAVLIVVKVAGGSTSASSVRTAVSPAALSELSSIPLATLVAAAQAPQNVTGVIHPPANLPAGVPALTSGGKPQILYIGAEYCPYCAAERWPLVIALSKFGTFSNLTSTKSASNDLNPDTPTFSFYGSTYTSPYLTFTPVETYNRAGKTLQSLTPTQQQLALTYDAPPYISGTAGAIPFVDLGGKYLVSGTEYDGSAFSGLDFDPVLSAIVSSSSQTSVAAEAVAGRLIGSICTLTNNQPSTVCSAVPPSLKTGQAGSGNQGASSSG